MTNDYRSGVGAEPPDLDAEGIEPVEPTEAFEVRESEVGPAEHGQRLDKVLTRLAPEFSRNHLQGLVGAGDVRVAGRVVTQVARKLRAGQALSLTLRPPAETLAFRPEAMPLVVCHEDEHVLVVNKPAGLVVHPAPGHWSGTLLNGLLAWHAGAAALPRAGIVHRLDKDTSGLMVVGKTLEAVTTLVRDMAERSIHRRYMALAHGRAAGLPPSVDAPIGRDPVSRVRMAVVSGGRPARTDVLPVAEKGGVTAVWCTLHTGRTHQIRVHMAHVGHPLLGDTLYGGRPMLGLERQALHAAELAFAHPVTRQPLRLVAEPPDDLAKAWATVVSS